MSFARSPFLAKPTVTQTKNVAESQARPSFVRRGPRTSHCGDYRNDEADAAKG